MSYSNYISYKNSEVDWLNIVPQHWVIDRLKWSVKFCKNGIWGSDPEGINDIACIRVADFNRTNLRINSDSLTYRSIEDNDKKDRILSEGDLLLEKSGGGEKQLVGTVIQFTLPIVAVSSNFISRMPISNGFDSRFLTYLNYHLYCSHVNYRSIKQTTGIQNLDSQQYLNELVAFPPIEEQQSIAKFLDYKTSQIAALIEKKEKLLKLLEEKRIALITSAVTGRLQLSPPGRGLRGGLTHGSKDNVTFKPSGIFWLGNIPEHWKVKRLRFSVLLNNDKIETDENELPYIGLENIESWTGKKIETEYSPEGIASIFKKDDVLFGKLRPYLAKVLLAQEKGCCTTEALVLRSKTNVLPKYLSYYLLSNMFIDVVNSSTFGSKMPRASWEFIGSLPFLLPPIEEQKCISEFLDKELGNIIQLSEQVNKAIDKLKEYRTSLITSAVTGKIDLRNWQPPSNGSANVS